MYASDDFVEWVLSAGAQTIPSLSHTLFSLFRSLSLSLSLSLLNIYGAGAQTIHIAYDAHSRARTRAHTGAQTIHHVSAAQGAQVHAHSRHATLRHEGERLLLPLAQHVSVSYGLI